jgi:hypothetical protein
VKPEPPCSQAVKASILAWCEDFVLDLQLCPFARAPLESGGVRIEVCSASDMSSLRRAFLRELDLLQSSPESRIATTLLVFSAGLEDFDVYLQFLARAEELVGAAGLEGLIQLASFHPLYRFQGEPAGAPGHFSNRAPYPVIHLLRESMVTRLVATYPQPEKIPLANIHTLECLGSDELERRWQRLRRD